MAYDAGKVEPLPVHTAPGMLAVRSPLRFFRDEVRRLGATIQPAGSAGNPPPLQVYQAEGVVGARPPLRFFREDLERLAGSIESVMDVAEKIRAIPPAGPNPITMGRIDLTA